MARYSREKILEHTALIRSILVQRTDTTILEIKSILAGAKNPLNLDKDYINKLVNKIRKERANRMDYRTLNVTLAKFEDEAEALKERLWEIIRSATSKPGEKIYAIAELRKTSTELFDKMFDAGVFERKLGKLKTEDSKLTEEQEDLIKQAIEYATHRGKDTKGSSG